jgi:hypothetical protein
MGKAMFNSRTLYTEAFDHKGPLIFFIYGIGYLISNASFLGMYIIESICWGLMLSMAYLTARLYVDKIYAFVIALAYSLFALSHSGEGGSAEEFILIFEVIGLFFFLRYFKNKETAIHDPKVMLMHGILCAVVFFIKFNLIIFWFFPLLAIFINLIRSKEYRNLLHNILAFTIGFLIITLPLCIYFLANNALSEAWNVYIELNRSYAKLGSIMEIAENLIVRFYLRLRFETLEFIIILVGAIWFPYKYIANKLNAISITLSFLSLYIVIFMATGYVHYYAIPYAVFAIPGLIVISKYIRLNNSRTVYITALVIFLIFGINKKSFFGRQINDVVKREAPKTYVDEFESIITKEKNPTLMNLGLDLGNSIFTRLNIVPNVKYFIAPNLKYEIYPEMRNAQTRVIENKEVQFIILCSNSPQFKYFHNLPTMNQNYTIVSEIYDDIDAHAFFYLYKRND